ncbi:carboxypeptidase regulatory-like domain-containing protein [uncultured Paraglaciecola sp.]|uniref:TonB-dependent receptor n=1 Tax=uncultured Paraglaciecola sp. TaxID=1765024 RepID=UPI00262B769B|nr:carboxypeptidase regulatory-like domain-containing protein [uncultured Paraglaciecola sp.]
MSLLRKSVTALAVAASLGLSASAYAADSGGLKIRVTDANGNAVAGAVVKVQSPESLITKEGVSDSEGNVRLIGLDPSNKYEVSIGGEGYQPFSANNVRVVTGKSLNLSYAMTSSDMETIVVSGRQFAAIDTSSTSAGIDLTLDMIESLPTARNYQAYLQLAPGTKPSTGGNPSSKSGVNYSDTGGTVGSSSDNIYYIDNINVTDNNTGTFGANFNSEIIQEQRILTGGIAAEYAGGAGLVSRVITKSGSNEFHGSINYYTQNDGLVSDNEHEESNSFSTYDTAFTLGGPIIKDKLWFFSSFQIKNREEDVADPETGELQRTIKDESDLGFAKITWQATDNDRFVVSYFNDPTDISGSSSASTFNNRDRARKQGGDNIHLEYSHSWDDLIVTAEYASHEGELSDLAADQSTRNDVAYLGGNPTGRDLSLGGRGSNSLSNRDSTEIKVSAEYYLDTDFGSHVIKTGYSKTESVYKTSLEYTGDGAQYTSIPAQNAGTTFGSYTTDEWTGTTDISDSDSDVNGILDEMMTSDSAYYLGLLDSDNDGEISRTELDAMTFDSTEGNPDGLYNVFRIDMTQTSPVQMSVDGQVFFVQDQWSNDNGVSVNLGLRAEKYEHISSAGDNIHTFDWEIAPRLSAAWDINNDGASKVFAFFGRYYDPIRTDMTNFAGNLTGPVREEQVYAGDRWLTFRTRGGSKGGQDAYFVPNIKTPYTDEILLGYSQALFDDMSLEITYTNRVTKDIMEDYDLGTFSDPDNAALVASPFYLPYSYFGYDSAPNSNFVIGTLAGAKREYQGVELAFRKRRTDNWSMLASFTYNDAQGNSNSDGNADYQGDVLELDPAAPNMWGDQPGNIKKLAKVAGTYYFDNGIEVGAVYNWNSGTLYSTNYVRGSRHFPLREDEAYDFGGINYRWVQEGVVAANTSPSYGTLDVRVKYVHDFEQFKAEFFLDMFNVLDDQAVVREQDIQAGDGIYAFGEGIEWVQPRRLYLGARLSF